MADSVGVVSLEGRTAVVTGGGSGIGFAIARQLALSGTGLVIVGRRAKVLEDAAAKLRDETGRPVAAVPGDVREDETLNRAMDTAYSSLGGLDIVVNNAGGQFISPAELISRRGWQAVVDIALTGTFLWSQRAAQHWIAEDRSGVVLNVVGPFRSRATPGIAHSGAARAAVVQLAKTLAAEWAPFGIRVNNIGPAVLTDGMRQELADGAPGVIANLERRLPAGRWGRPDEIGALAAFLVSDAAAFISGETIVMDGGAWQGEGLTMRPPSSRRWVREAGSDVRRDWAVALLDDGDPPDAEADP